MNNSNDREKSELEEAFPFHGFRKSWSKYDKIVDEMPFEDPLEAEAWKKRIRDDKKLRYAILDDYTEKFLRMLKARLRPKRNYILVMCGPMGTGKSMGACTICWITQKEIPTAIYKVVMGINAIRLVFPTLPSHGIAVNDEDLGLTGKGSDTVAVHVSNQLKFAREGERNLILSAKWYQNIHIANYYLEAFGFNPETKTNRFMLRSLTGRWLGVVTLKAEFPPEFYQPFIDAKKKMDKQMAKSHGELSAFSEFDLKATAEAIEQKLREIKFPSTRKSLIKAFIIQQSELEENYDRLEFQIPALKMPDVIARIQVNLMRNPIKKETTRKESNVPHSSAIKGHKLLLETEYEDLFYMILDQIIVRGTEPLKKDVFKLKCENNSNLEISRILGIATGSVSNYHHEILKYILGDAGEDAFSLDLDTEGVDYIHGGYNTPDPDYIINSEFKLIDYDIFPYVVSFKTYFIFRIHKAMTEIAASEISFAQEHECPLFLVAYECHTKIIRIFEVFLEGQKNIPSSSSCETRNPPRPEHPLPPAPPSPPVAPTPPPGTTPPLEAGGAQGFMNQLFKSLPKEDRAELVAELFADEGLTEQEGYRVLILKNLLQIGIASTEERKELAQFTAKSYSYSLKNKNKTKAQSIKDYTRELGLSNEFAEESAKLANNKHFKKKKRRGKQK